MTEIAIAGGNDNHYLTQAQYNPGAETNLVDYFPLYGLVLLMEETSHQELVDLNGDLPTDTHLVCWMSYDESLRCDAVRAYKKSDIFDCYKDLGRKIISIDSGYGAIKPKLFVNQTKEKVK